LTPEYKILAVHRAEGNIIGGTHAIDVEELKFPVCLVGMEIPWYQDEVSIVVPFTALSGCTISGLVENAAVSLPQQQRPCKVLRMLNLKCQPFKSRGRVRMPTAVREESSWWDGGVEEGEAIVV
jgi:hypothetical protein